MSSGNSNNGDTALTMYSKSGGNETVLSQDKEMSAGNNEGSPQKRKIFYIAAVLFAIVVTVIILLHFTKGDAKQNGEPDASASKTDSNNNAYFDVNECNVGTDYCDPKASCANTDGSYTCECLPGYTGDGFTCTDIDECTKGETCDEMASCTNTDGSYTCECRPGYTGNGIFCRDADECNNGEATSCDINAWCLNIIGSYVCSCRFGYIGDGYDCTEFDIEIPKIPDFADLFGR